MGSETKSSRFWEKEEDRLCRMCKKEEEGIEHVLRRCEHTGEDGIQWERHFKEEKRIIAKFKKIRWKREEREKEKEGKDL